MQNKIIQWLVEQIMKTFDPDVIKAALCSALRALAATLVALAAKTDPATIDPKLKWLAVVDDQLAAKFSDVVDQICKALGH